MFEAVGPELILIAMERGVRPLHTTRSVAVNMLRKLFAVTGIDSLLRLVLAWNSAVRLSCQVIPREPIARAVVLTPIKYENCPWKPQRHVNRFEDNLSSTHGKRPSLP